MIGICGDNCETCPRLRATADNDAAALERIAALWIRLGWRDKSVRPSELRCSGCGNTSTCAYPEQKACAVERELANCGECDDYPCPIARRTFDRIGDVMARCRSCCSVEEYEVLSLAYGQKRENLDRIHDRRMRRFRGK